MDVLSGCEKCLTQLTVKRCMAIEPETKKIVEQAVITCEKGCIIVPYFGEAINNQTLREIDPEYDA